MSGVNKAILIGRLGKDPEVRHLENGAAVAQFSMATSEVYKDKTTGEKKEITDWHNIVMWRGLAEIAAKYLHKGDQIYVEGKIRTRTYDKDGIPRYVTEVVADSMTMLSTKRVEAAPKPTAQDAPPVTEPAPVGADDLPF